VWGSASITCHSCEGCRISFFARSTMFIKGLPGLSSGAEYRPGSSERQCGAARRPPQKLFHASRDAALVAEASRLAAEDAAEALAAAAIVRSAIPRSSTSPAQSSQRTVAVCCPPGEHHEIPAEMITELLRALSCGAQHIGAASADRLDRVRVGRVAERDHRDDAEVAERQRAEPVRRMGREQGDSSRVLRRLLEGDERQALLDRERPHELRLVENPAVDEEAAERLLPRAALSEGPINEALGERAGIRRYGSALELLEAEGMRDRIVLCCGGPRVTNLMAAELGYDAGFGRGTLPSEVAAFIATRLSKVPV